MFRFHGGMSMANLNLPLGFEFFSEVIENDCYYIDKTLFIKELVEEPFKVNLITRPRRFGKTLAMTMLADFFDIRRNSRSLFQNLKIIKEEALCRQWMNQWPVLFLTLKDVDGDRFEDAMDMLKDSISTLFKNHSYLADSTAVDPDDQKLFCKLKAGEGNASDLKSSLTTLTRMMNAHYHKPVILLIDEYDVPLAKAYDHSYYQKMLPVIRSLLGRVWKTNPSLKFAVVTGCLRIAKESIFTGANNFISNSVAGFRYRESFGFSESEVRQLLKDAECLDQYDSLKKWYDGYRFGGSEIYCPWDVVNHVSLLQKDPAAKPANYWKDTSHNHIIRKFIDIKGPAIHEKFETLLSGGIIEEHIVEDLTYDLDHSEEDNLWSILYLTGYLTQAVPDFPSSKCISQPERILLKIPNEEVKTIFAETVFRWFKDTLTGNDRSALFKAWWNKEDAQVTNQVSSILFNTISYFDYKEDYYHAFLAGLFSGAGYEVSSNSEQGTGRADVTVKDRRNRRALIIEVKRSSSEKNMKKNAQDAISQIIRRQYAETLLAKGYEMVLCYGAAFFQKKCCILCNLDPCNLSA